MNSKHGETARGMSPEYVSWVCLKQRCTNPKHPAFHNYGGKGVRICEQWAGPEGFPRFLRDMGRKPTPGHTLDRIDSDGHYEPGNCRWSNWTEQGRNRRTNRVLTVGGETLCIAEWSERTGITQSNISNRLRDGWSADEAVTTPVRLRRERGKR